MDLDRAMRQTIMLAENSKTPWVPKGVPELSFVHIADMRDRWERDIDKMSDTKKSRWLGWMQAAVVANLYPVVTLEDMKQINKSCGGHDVRRH